MMSTKREDQTTPESARPPVRQVVIVDDSKTVQEVMKVCLMGQIGVVEVVAHPHYRD